MPDFADACGHGGKLEPAFGGLQELKFAAERRTSLTHTYRVCDGAHEWNTSGNPSEMWARGREAELADGQDRACAGHAVDLRCALQW
jgi:hypothetical protein